jgi:hypothetical protein
MDFLGLYFLGWCSQRLQPTSFIHEPTIACGKWGCISHQAHLSYVEFLREGYNTLHKKTGERGDAAVRREQLVAMTTAELLRLIEEAEDVIADREHEPKDAAHHEVVERRRGKGGRWLQRELVKCGKPHCSKDRDGAGHGPYWYLYYTNQRGKYTSKYIGKHLTPELAEEFGVAPV